MQDLNKLIDELLKRELRPNTREDLATWRQEIAAGTLSDDDARYIRGLHARVVLGGVPKAREPRKDETPAPKPADADSLRSQLDESRRREEALAAERDRLEAEVAALRREIEALKAGKG
jgi:predicted RNase H-like nuclease (RuvC/YqgF family)